MKWIYEWFLYFSGINYPPMAIWWGGLGSCLGYITVFGLAWRHLNCHADGCKRLGVREHEHDGQKVKLCRRCHRHVTGEKPHTREEMRIRHAAKKSEMSNA
jgi:hypothetical protein